MKVLLYVVVAALLTYASCYSLGAMLLRALRLRLYRSEERFIAFLAGSAVLSTLVFLLGVTGLARKSVFLAITVPLIAIAAWRGWNRPRGDVLPRAPLLWRIAFWVVFAAFTWIYLPHVLLPETSPDGVAYHVALVAKYTREHRISPITTSMYANLSQGVEMLFLYAFSIGKHTAAAACHFLFLLALPFGILSYARRIGHPGAGVVAALLVYASPIAARTGTVAYVDVAAAAVAFALFYTLQIWREQTGNWRLLVLAGLLAGFGYAVKYPGGIGVVYAVGFVVWFTIRDSRLMIRSAAIVGLCAIAVMSPWLIKNALWLSNPFSPFFNTWFPNPYVYPAFEREYVDFFRAMGGVSIRSIPIEATVRGERLQGVIGPVFLFAPLALLALRRREGRHLLLACAVYLAPYFGNIGTRFLLPALPFIALSLALGMQSFRGMLPILLLAHLVYSLPAVVPAYSQQYAWRLEPPDWNAALRKTPETDYLESRLTEYPIVRIMDTVVGDGERVFAASFGARSYHRQDVIIGYESAFGNRIQDMLHRAMFEDLRMKRRYAYSFPAKQVRRLRVVQTQADPAPVRIAEIRVLSGGVELSRAPQWRLRASVNPWEVQAAFDNSPLTVWTAGRATEPGMYVQIDFGSPAQADGVTVTVPQSQDWVAMRIETDAGDGRWTVAATEAAVDVAPWPARARAIAAQELKDAGIRWIAVRDDDLLAGDLFERSEQWGIREVAYAKNIRLWRIE